MGVGCSYSLALACMGLLAPRIKMMKVKGYTQTPILDIPEKPRLPQNLVFVTNDYELHPKLLVLRQL